LINRYLESIVFAIREKVKVKRLKVKVKTSRAIKP